VFRKFVRCLKSVALAGVVCFAIQGGSLVPSATAGEWWSDIVPDVELAGLIPTWDGFPDAMHQANSGNTGGYVAVNYQFWQDVTGVPLEYQADVPVDWDFDINNAGSVQLGTDMGLIRLDLKLTAMDGGIDSIDGVTGKIDRSNVAIGTANAYWDILRYQPIPDFQYLAFTPYIGVGGGMLAFRATATKVGAAVSSQARFNGGDNHLGWATALAGRVGLQVEILDHLGLTVGYNYVRPFGIWGVSQKRNVSHDLHMAEAGVRLTF